MMETNKNYIKEEVWAKIRRAQAGEDGAMNAFIEENMGLVRSIALRFRDRGAEYEDLVQIGVMGMFRAVKSFDTSYDTAFSTYAVPLIIGEIRRSLRDDGMIKVSREIKRQGMLILRERERLQREMGHEPLPDEVAKNLGITMEDYMFALEAASPVRSLSEPTESGEDALPLESTLSDDTGQMEKLTDRLTLEQSVKKLNPTEQQVLYLRYKKELSQRQTAEILGLTQVKVSRMEKKIFEQLRRELTGS